MSNEMQFSNADLNNPMFLSVINKIDGQVGILKGKDMFEWNKFIPALEKHQKTFNKTRATLLSENAKKDADGNIMFIDGPTGKVPDLGDKAESVESQFKEVLESTFSIKFRGLTDQAFDALSDVLAPKEIRVCDKLRRDTHLEVVSDEREHTSKETVGK